MTTGRKLIPDEIDFSLPGLMPIEWSRFYASDLTADSVLGRGWVLPWEQSLRRQGTFIYLTDNQGREVPFVTLQPGERIYNPHEQVYLVCTEGGHYVLQTLDNLFFYFGEVPDTNTDVPLQRIENALGHFLHFTRRDAKGKIVKDPLTGEGRRVDFVIKRKEVTSLTAPEIAQLEKMRIREVSGIVVREPGTKKLIEVDDISAVIRAR
ncbi:hypothetical protein TZ03_25195 [Pseudomonas sp. 10-1B]|nr:hypothetical protein TZ03_25195 [Pseudomonas sp. 10-1B]